LLPLASHRARVFRRPRGEKKNRSRARIKFLIQDLGIENSRELFLEERSKLIGGAYVAQEANRTTTSSSRLSARVGIFTQRWVIPTSQRGVSAGRSGVLGHLSVLQSGFADGVPPELFLNFSIPKS